jgi:hypothetical protein
MIGRAGNPEARSDVHLVSGGEPTASYRVTFDNAGQTCGADGLTLASQGLTIRLDGALTSELLVVEAVGAARHRSPLDKGKPR